MDTSKQSQILEQYINQYKPVISSTLISLRAEKDHLHIPYAQFIFSVIDYFGLLYTVAVNRKYDKRDSKNFKNFFSSSYFPRKDRCKAEFLYFMRNGLIHQIFAKGCSVGVTSDNQLFFRDANNGNIPALNLNYLDMVTVNAIDSFTDDLNTKSGYIDNLHDLLIRANYGFNDHVELDTAINTSLTGNIDNLFSDCL